MNKEMYNLDKDIAIIGFEGAFAKATSIEEYKNVILEGERAFTWFSKEDLENSGVSQDLLNDENYKSVSGYMDGIDLFDASFFGLNRREAELMDPQFRVFMEHAYHALESGGYSNQLDNLKCGVFATSGMQLYSGKNLNTYFRNNIESHTDLLENVDAVKIKILNEADYLPTQLAYRLNLKGPCMSINTACSSALVAVNSAVQSLRFGECDIALAGGCSIHTPHKAGYLYTEGGIYSPTGECNPFSDAANGIIGGNGVGVILLKRLKKAIEDGDQIHAVIKGVATNNDGSRKISFTAPSIEGQQENIEQALNDAGISAEAIGYVEAHGTGTGIGDPIETTALTNAFLKKSKSLQFASLGSVKANIGHLDASSGIASLIKTIILLKERKIPLQVGYQNNNPLINFEKSPFYVNKELLDWKNVGGLRNCLVASLGAGGTNAHLVLSEWNTPLQRNEEEFNDTSKNLFISAKSEPALLSFIEKYIAFLKDTDSSLESICKTAAVKRKQYDCRFSLSGKTKDELATNLTSYLNKGNTSQVQREEKPKKKRIKPVFVFTGQGAQFMGMGQQLYNTYPVFKSVLDELDQVFVSERGTSLVKLMFYSSLEQLSLTENTQPVMFAYEYALYKLWESFGLIPDVVMGHSVGEYTAACVSGIMSWQDALFLLMKRGELMSRLTSEGGMLSINLQRKEVLKIMNDLNLELDIAAENGIDSIVVSGVLTKLKELKYWCEQNAIKATLLKVSHAFHSVLMEPIMNEMRIYLDQVIFNLPRKILISNVSGLPVSSELINTQYWIDHMRNEVKFYDSLKYIMKKGKYYFVEIGPKPILSSLISNSFETADVIFSANEENEQHTFSCAIGKLYTLGIELKWEAGFDVKALANVTLPSYPFQRESYWLNAVPNQKQEIQSVLEVNKFHSNKIYFLDWIEFVRNTTDQKIVFEDTFVIVGEISNPIVKSYLNKMVDSYHFTFQSIWNIKDDQSFNSEFIELINNERVQLLYVADNGLALDKSTHDLIRFLNQIESARMGIPLHFHLLTQVGLFSEKSIDEILWGVIRTAQYEMEQMKVFISDFSLDKVEDEIEVFLNSLKERSKFQLSFRGLKCFELVLRSEKKKEVSQDWLIDVNTILITGGFGEIGLYLAKNLALRNIPNIILVGRCKCSSETLDLIASWETQKVKIKSIVCDITNHSDFEASLNQVISKDEKIDCIIHLAGSLADSTIAKASFDDVKKVFSSKVNGIEITLDVCASHHPNRLVLFSSIASLFGAAGQANYAAANSYLNHLSSNSKLRGLKTHTICWGPWKEIGMATRGHAFDTIKALNIELISKKEAFDLMTESINSNKPLALISGFSDKIRSDIGSIGMNEIGRQFWRKDNNDVGTNKNIQAELYTLSTNSQHTFIMKKIQELVNNCTGYFSFSDRILLESFHDLGIDSLGVIQLKNTINKTFDVLLKASDFYTYATIASMTTYIHSLICQKLENELDSNSTSDEIEKENLWKLLEDELLD